MADLPSELRTLVERYGAHVLDDADGLRATLNDFLDEDSSPGDVNLLVDAVRFGSLERLNTLLGQGAEASAALTDVAEGLAQRRGGDAESAYWACAVLGYAADLLSPDLIPGTWERPSSLPPPANQDTSPTDGADVTHVVGQSGAASLGDPNVTRYPGGETAPPDLTSDAQAPDEGEPSDAGLTSPVPNPAVLTSTEPEAGWRSRLPALLAAAAVVVAIGAGGTWLLLRDTSSASSGRTGATGSPPTSAAVGLLEAMQQANLAAAPATPFPGCVEQTADHVTCDSPAYGIGSVDVRTYRSRDALYVAYRTAVKAASGTFDSGDCNGHNSTGEISWNHDFHHPAQYRFTDVASGNVDLGQAEGRVFCTLDQNGELVLIWTDGHSNILASISGSLHEATYQWWRNEHHMIELPDPAASSSTGSTPTMPMMT